MCKQLAMHQETHLTIRNLKCLTHLLLGMGRKVILIAISMVLWCAEMTCSQLEPEQMEENRLNLLVTLVHVMSQPSGI